MNGEGLLEGLRFTTSCQVIAVPLHSWRGARGSGGEVCASFDAWPESAMCPGARVLIIESFLEGAGFRAGRAWPTATDSTIEGLAA
jgi:hypothetical protein